MSASRFPLLTIAVLVAGGTALEILAMVRDVALSRVTMQLWYFTYSYAVTCWVLARRRHGPSAPYQCAAFLFIAWPVLAPWMLFKWRRWRGFALGLGLTALHYVPNAAALAAYFLFVVE
jgi:hypothetical protein